MIVKGDPPAWALDLVEQVCKDYRRRKPTYFVWKNFNRDTSSGVAWRGFGYTARYSKSGRRFKPQKNQGTIHIKAGRDEKDARLVLLHELAHHIVSKTGKGKRMGHTMRFWNLAFELYPCYGVDLDYAYNREKFYKKKATVAFERAAN